MPLIWIGLCSWYSQTFPQLQSQDSGSGFVCYSIYLFWHHVVISTSSLPLAHLTTTSHSTHNRGPAHPFPSSLPIHNPALALNALIKPDVLLS